MNLNTLTGWFAPLLLDTSIKGTVLLLLGCMTAWLCRRSSAALRHSIWLIAMLGLLLLPIASLALPAWRIRILPTDPVAVQEAEVGPLIPDATVATAEIPQGESSLKSVLEPSLTPSFPVNVEPTASRFAEIDGTALLVCSGWLSGVVFSGSLLLIGFWKTIKLRWASSPVMDSDWLRMLGELQRRLNLTRAVELREHETSIVPLTCGMLRPVVLLPKLAHEWREPMLRAVLLHELAHVQRGDVASQMLGRLACVAYWFHPLSWYALRRLRQEREQACDDAVVHAGEKASDYAEQLLQVARLCCVPSGLSSGVAMAEGSSLEHRVKSLFDSARGHGPVRRIVAVFLVIIGVLAVGAISPVEPVSTSAAAMADADYLKSFDGRSGPVTPEDVARLKPVFGEAKRGIQLGLAVASARTSFPVGDRILLWLFFRNIGDKELTFNTHLDFIAYPPSVKNEQGESVVVSRVYHFMDMPTTKLTLKPGEVWCIKTPGLALGDGVPGITPVIGTFQLTYSKGLMDANTALPLLTEGPLPGQPAEMPDWSENLTTGTVEFEIVRGSRWALEAHVFASQRTDFVADAANSVAIPAPKESATTSVNSATQPVTTEVEKSAEKQTPTITGQIIDEKKVGIAGAEVALVAYEDGNGGLRKQGRVIATTVADPLGNYSLNLPAEESDRRKFGAVWAKAKGHVAARRNWSTVISALPDRKAELTLAETNGIRVRVLDATGQPLPEAKLSPISVGVPRGVGYPLPKEWEEESTGITDADGNAVMPNIDPESLKGLDLIPPGNTGTLRYGQNYFLNVRPTSGQFEFQLPETGSIKGQLIVVPGSMLPEKLMLTLKSFSKPFSNSVGIVTVPVDADGKFHVDKIPVGRLFVPAFLPEDQPLRADVPARIDVEADRELNVKIPVGPGVKIRGRVQKSDTQEGVADFPVVVLYGQTISNRSADFEWLKFDLKTDANGQYECFVPPGPINVQATLRVDGYSSAHSWLPPDQRGNFGGMRFVVPAGNSFDLGAYNLSRNVGIKGRVVDMQNEPLVDWSVYGFPNIPDIRQDATMNSMAGVHTDKQGNFSGSYPQTYPPAYWKVSHRVWKTKYEFDDLDYAGKVISRDPLILQVDTAKELVHGDIISIDPEAPVSPVSILQAGESEE